MGYTFRMKKGKKSRYKPQAGDLFFYRILSDSVHFGRVIKVGVGPIPDSNLLLLYFYSATAAAIDDIPAFSCSDLLIPPLITNEDCWLQGYFQHISNKPLQDWEVLAKHCFYSSLQNKYFDEESREMMYRTEPCGTKGWSTIIGIDSKLSDALGLSEDEDTDDDDSYHCDDGYLIWPGDRINEEVVTLQIRIPESSDPATKVVDRGAIEEVIDDRLKGRNLAEWYASGTFFSDYSHIDYDIHPGQFPDVHALVEEVLKEFGVNEYRILVRD